MKLPHATYTPFEEIDHTADVGIRARGESLSSLFVNAAKGMMWLIYPHALNSDAECRDLVRVHASTSDTLLREWLAEILYVHAAKHVIPRHFDIRSISENKLEASVRSTPMSDAMCNDVSEIKAVTWHGLSIKRDGSMYVAEIIFDI